MQVESYVTSNKSVVSFQRPILNNLNHYNKLFLNHK